MNGSICQFEADTFDCRFIAGVILVCCKEATDLAAAKEMFGGRLSEDFIADKVGNSNFSELVELDFPQSGIQTVILNDGQLFSNLRRFVWLGCPY